MPKKKKGRKSGDSAVGEEFKIAVNISVQEFRHNEAEKDLEFPSSFSNSERAYIHKLAQNYGLKSKSKGKEANRYLTLYKKEKAKDGSIATFDLTRDSRNESHGLLQCFPVNQKERLELQPRTERKRYGVPGGQLRETPKTTGRLNNGIPQVPPTRAPSDLDTFRQTLPVFPMREEILQTIGRDRVVIVSGETGSGKTTQVPQFILDECSQQKRNCRILCTQPRRLSALSIAERVAAERGESIGQAVGYQIRLESRVSPKTVLTFCTNGVLLRTLMAGDNAMQSVTHVIVDEIHERDRFSDFLLIQLRELLPKAKHLHLVLMSAALDTELFIRYFNNCPVVTVPGKLFEVEELFLEDGLKCTGYTNSKMQVIMKEKSKLAKQKAGLDAWYKEPSVRVASTLSEEDSVAKLSQDMSSVSGLGRANSKAMLDSSVDVNEMPESLTGEMDSVLSGCWLQGTEEAFGQLLHLIMNENVSADYAHSETSATPLMLAAGRGNAEVVERLLTLGANATQRASNDMTPLDWAKKFNQAEIVEILQAHITNTQTELDDETELINESVDISSEDKELLQVYHHSFDDDRVDHDLIGALLTYICSNSEEGAILVFLPGYDDIVSLRDSFLSEDSQFSNTARYQIYTLHSSMQSSDQKKVFRKTTVGIRKIILSTNIAETSVTINDVVFVIDSGKVKEKSFDALTSVSMLKSNWISKSSAKQRKGRAGRCRPGMCFHMMSRVRYRSLPDFQTPEILRLPLQELCLHTKLLAPLNMPIADFISKAPEPPAFLIVQNAVQLLKAVDAIDSWEDLTELGHHLADLPLEPRLGKMVLYSIVLKCLDPILTIVCALAYRDPFVLPNHPSQKRAAMAVRKKYAANTFSDHMALLRTFQAWQRARSDGWERAFCARNFLSQATMEMIVGMRTQLLGQLRAAGFVRARGPGDIRDLNTNSENWAVVKASLCAGMYPNIIKVDREKQQMTTQTESKVGFHPNSVIHDANDSGKLSIKEVHRRIVTSLPTDWLIYEEKTRFHRFTSVRCATIVSPLAIVLFTGPARLPLMALFQPDDNIAGAGGQARAGQEESDSEAEEEERSQRAGIKIDDWIVLWADTEAANLALVLRQKWHTLFLRRMRMPAKPWTPGDEAVLRTIVKVLSNEEQALGLQQPVGVGQRPKPMAMDHFNNTPPRRTVGNRFGQHQAQTGGNQASNTSPKGKGQNFRSSSYGNNNKQWDYNSPPSKSKLSTNTTKPVSTLNASAPPWQGRAHYQTGTGSSRVDGGSSKIHGGSSKIHGGSGGIPGGSGGIPGGSGGIPGGSGGIPGGSGGIPGGSGGIPGGSGGIVDSSSSSGMKATNSIAGFSNKYYIMKCNDQLNIDMSYTNGLWGVSPNAGRALSNAFKTTQVVFLIFTLQGSGQFQGFGKLMSDVHYPRTLDWRDPSLTNGGEVSVQWMKRANVSYNQTRFLLNPWNDNQRIQLSRDGQELEPTVGEALIQLWARVSLCPGADASTPAPLHPQPAPLHPQPEAKDRPDSPVSMLLASQTWPTDARPQPIAHSSPAAYGQGPAAFVCSRKPASCSAVEAALAGQQTTWSVDDGSEGVIHKAADYPSTEFYH